MARNAEQIRAAMAELQRELDEAEAAERQAQEAEKAKHIIAKAAALKALYSDLKANHPEALPKDWLETPQQALPRETLIARKFGLSETEAANAKEAGRQAIERL